MIALGGASGGYTTGRKEIVEILRFFLFDDRLNDIL
jgi:hypothetical protein